MHVYGSANSELFGRQPSSQKRRHTTVYKSNIREAHSGQNIRR